MSAVDFFLCCSGAAIIILSTGVTVHMLRRPGEPQRGRRNVDGNVNPEDALALRLNAIQNVRYAPTMGRLDAARRVPPIVGVRPTKKDG